MENIYIYRLVAKLLKKRNPFPMIRRLYLLGVLLIVSASASFAQVGSGELRGKLKDAETGEPLPFVNIIIEAGKRQVGGTSDFDGNYILKPIPPGTYDVTVSFVGYNTRKITGVKINNDKITFLDIEMEAGVRLDEVEIFEYSKPLIDKDGGASGGTVTREEIQKMPGRSATSMAATVGGVQTNAAGVSIRGAREENTFYFIDGIKVRGSTNLPKAAIEEVQVMTGGIPASYGDMTGGVIAITTRGATSNYFGGVDIITSGFANEDGGGLGFDRFSQTQVEGVFSGPLLFKKDAEGNRERALLGFFLSGNYRNSMDTRPSIIGNFRLRDEVRQNLVQNPLNFVLSGINTDPSDDVFIDADGNVQDATTVTPNLQGNSALLFLRENDWEEIPARQNSRFEGGSITTKIDIATTPNIDLAVGGTFDITNSRNFSYANSLMNYQNNGQVRNTTARGFVRFTHRLSSPDDKQDRIIKNAFYSLMADYSNVTQRVWDARHQDNLFNYGHVGRFEEEFVNNYTFRSDTLPPGFYHTGYRRTATTFTPSETNADMAAYTSALYNEYDRLGFTVRTGDDIDAAGGIRNGRVPQNVYGLYTAIGTPFNSFQNFEQEQLRFTGSFSADVKGHAIRLGFEYEEFTQRSFGVSPVGLWNAARQLTNSHIRLPDQNNLISTDFIDGNYFFTYARANDLPNQTTFDRNLRASLGLDPNGTDFIQVDALDPDQLDISFFNADELLNQGAEYVSYYGYDHRGNRIRGTRSIDDFFTARDENGDFTRERGAFAPIYISGYIMDKFAFDDIVFNVGLRVDRFDANQFVLKDQFVVGEALTVADTRGRDDFLGTHPGVVGDDWVVYVDDIQNANQINGYRSGNTWFNAQGVEVSDPRALRGASGIAPLLANPSETGENLTGAAFERYTPQWNFMPRIAFSFPISDEAVFFAHYDILTQRPTGQNILNPVDYLFLQNRGNAALANPNLRPTRTVDYELGFQQVLSKTSSLKIAAFYRETRDEIQARRLLEAFPSTYTSFDNFDFGTIKGLTLTYDLRRTGNITLRAAYTLQFASATGSNAGSAINLVNSGEPNLRVIFPTDRDQRHLLITTFDYRYGAGKDYNGPVLNGRQILKNTGLNIVSTFGSGTPYSQQRIATGNAFISPSGAPQLEGTVNGSRLPWQFRIDAQIDRSIELTFGKDKEKPKKAFLNIYFLINNLLNTQNIINVYRYTGNPDDDGFLQAPLWQPTIESQLDEESFRQLYGLKVNSPFNFGIARTIQLGVRLDF